MSLEADRGMSKSTVNMKEFTTSCHLCRSRDLSTLNSILLATCYWHKPSWMGNLAQEKFILKFHWIFSEKSVVKDFIKQALKDFTQCTKTWGCHLCRSRDLSTLNSVLLATCYHKWAGKSWAHSHRPHQLPGCASWVSCSSLQRPPVLQTLLAMLICAKRMGTSQR